MSSRGKKKTTMAKLNREARLRERRDAKRVKKEARRMPVVGERYPDLTAADGDDDATPQTE
jgi:hypothetical protein